MANLTKSLVMPDGEAYEFIGRQYYGVAETVNNNLVLQVDIAGFTLESLIAGTRISVLCEVDPDSYPANSLNVSNTGAKNISTNSSGTNTVMLRGLWTKGDIVEFLYDGQKWLYINSRPRMFYAVCETAADTAAKVATKVMPYGIPVNGVTEGTMVVVNFSKGNTASYPTLSVGGTTAAKIIRSYTNATDDVSVGAFNPGVYLCVYVKLNSADYRWVLVGHAQLSDSVTLGSSTTYASSKAVSTLNSAVVQKYTKPSGGIPASDIASGVIPTAVSDLTNDSGYLTLADLPIYDGSVS